MEVTGGPEVPFHPGREVYDLDLALYCTRHFYDISGSLLFGFEIRMGWMHVMTCDSFSVTSFLVGFAVMMSGNCDAIDY